MSFFRRACSSSSTAYFRCNACSRLTWLAGGTFTAVGNATRPRSTPSRASFRHRDNMNGWISSASATACTSTPGN